eukprot:3519464-Prymnesium_polylepis.2
MYAREARPTTRSPAPCAALAANRLSRRAVSRWIRTPLNQLPVQNSAIRVPANVPHPAARLRSGCAQPPLRAPPLSR